MGICGVTLRGSVVIVIELPFRTSYWKFLLYQTCTSLRRSSNASGVGQQVRGRTT